MHDIIKNNPYYFKKICHIGHGFGASFNTLLSALHMYELGVFSGVEVNYKKTGNYYDSEHGDNWWEYYFEPIRVGNPEGAHILEYFWFPGSEITGLQGETKEENNRVLKKYIKVKSHILEKVDSFFHKYFNNEFVVGAFYRGTTARSGAEASLISYDEFSTKLFGLLNNKGISPKDCKIFIESDEDGFIDHMKSNFPHIIYKADQIRSKDGNPIHVHHSSPYKLGEDTLINILLMAKTNLIVKTQSNMIEVASHFNPDVPNIYLNDIRLYQNQDPRPLYKELKHKIKQGRPPFEEYVNLFSKLNPKFFYKQDLFIKENI